MASKSQSELEARSAEALVLLLERTARMIYPERAPDQMHPGQWSALRFLARANPEAATVAGLARYLGVTLGPASRAVSALERKGLVSSAPDAKDRRVNRLSLTEAGREMLAGDPALAAAQAVLGLSAPARDGLAEALHSLHLALSRAAEGDPFALDSTAAE